MNPPQTDRPETPSAIDLVNALNGDQIRDRLAQLDAEREALLALLRVVAKRERAQLRAAKAQVAS